VLKGYQKISEKTDLRREQQLAKASVAFFSAEPVLPVDPAVSREAQR